jgi:hypothetical protein
MGEFTEGVRPEEVVWPDPPVPRHMASGSGWERHRGGGRVSDRNPWKEDPHIPNPAQDGSSIDRTGTFPEPPVLTGRTGRGR